MTQYNIHNLVDMFDWACGTFSKKVAVVFGSKNITYGELKETVEKLAGGLYKLGLKEKDKVCLWLPNCPEFVYSYFAILKIGAIVVPVNSMFKREEAKYIVDDSQAKILICSIDKLEVSESILARVDALERLICVPSCKNSKASGFYDLFRKEEQFKESLPIDPDSIAEILYTSGTTGKPKGACLSHKNFITNVKDSSMCIKASSRDCVLCILPLFHSFASTVCMLLPIYRGAKIVIMRAIHPFKRVMRAIFKNRVTVFVAVPSLYNILVQTKLSWQRLLFVRLFNPVRVYLSGAAALSEDTFKKFQIKFRRPLLEGYGLTEASPVVSLSPLRAKRKSGSVGIAFPSLEVKIIDKEGKTLSRNQVGEILIKGPSVMKGYYRRKEETEKAILDGWLHTGDLGKVDEKGYIYIIGRAKDMINVRGLNVYPKEIEELLYKHPNVKEASVVGIHHRRKGEVPLAFIVPQGEVNQRQLIKYLRVNLASYKVPLKIFFKESLPKNLTGKILKRELRKEADATLGDINGKKSF